MALDSKWTTEDASDLYNIERWGNGFFNINEGGELVVNPGRNHRAISILDSINAASTEGLQAPFIVRFPEIIRQRICDLNSAFKNSIDEYGYRGNYRLFYPAKVNQHREVIQAVIDSTREFSGGVEAGSKAELFAMLLMTDNQIPILCNGFKDQTIIEMAFRATQLGRDITIVIEKPDELELIDSCRKKLDIKPKLGIRVKLAARSGGRWNASGGSKSKFGLNVSQLAFVCRKLDEAGMMDCLELLHFHPGSQVSNIRKIKHSLIEAARIYSELYKNGVPIKKIDVGGGLAVDYTGERNNSPSSMNYGLQEYANDVVYCIQQVCNQTNVPDPDIISESGRAITAHHSMIVVPVLRNDAEQNLQITLDESDFLLAPVLNELKEIHDSVYEENMSESFHDTQNAIETVWQMFAHGSLSLEQRRCAEDLASAIYRKVAGRLGELEFIPSELEDLRHQLAETYVANFSLFQALPDSWALDHVFPVVPIHRLDQRPTVRAVIGDITCDSDGQIKCFIGAQHGKKSLLVHELDDQPYYLGIFLIGAYQEALSDDHNLMGNFHVMTVSTEGSIDVRRGASTMDVLEHVHHSRELMMQAIESSLKAVSSKPALSGSTISQIRSFLHSVADSYTYLAPKSVATDPETPTEGAPHFAGSTAPRKHKTEINN